MRFRPYRFKWGAMVIALALIILAIDRFAPPEHVPWKPLDVKADIGFATSSQLFALSLAPRKMCLARLADTDMSSAEELGPKKNSSGCGWSVALQTRQSHGVKFAPAEITTLCPMAAGIYIWLGQVDKIAQNQFGSGLARVHHYGTYSCRKIAGRSEWSEHAFANAWDVAAFELSDGRMISVKKDWIGRTKKAKFLKKSRDAGCKLFRVVLSPDYNAAHEDHLHLDMGPSRSCR